MGFIFGTVCLAGAFGAGALAEYKLKFAAKAIKLAREKGLRIGLSKRG